MSKYLICECELERILKDLNRRLTETENKNVDKDILLDAISDYKVGR